MLIHVYYEQVEDEQEKFERLQKELLMDDPYSASYHNAKMRLVQRVCRMYLHLPHDVYTV